MLSVNTPQQHLWNKLMEVKPTCACNLSYVQDELWRRTVPSTRRALTHGKSPASQVAG